MGEINADARMEQWVCPNDRQLCLRAKLGAGWSVHSSKATSMSRSNQLNEDEQEQILNVIRRAEMVEQNEMERVGRLVERVENMKKNAMGNGSSHCVLCGDEFGLLGASPTYCDDCGKAVCVKCGVDTSNRLHQPLWLCKICSENRELWKRSGAWFIKGIPKYVIPKAGGGESERAKAHRSAPPRRPEPRTEYTPDHREYNTWSRTNQRLSDSSDQESSDSDDEISLKKKTFTFSTGTESAESDSLSCVSVPSTQNQPASSVGSYNRYATSNSPHDTDTDLSSVGALSRKGSLHSHIGTDSLDAQSRCDDTDQAVAKPAVSASGRTSPAPSYESDQHLSSPDPDASLGTLEFSLLYDSVNSALHCTVIRARNLRSTDQNGLSDPFVKLQLLPSAGKSYKLRTRTVHKTLEPEWSESLTYHGLSEPDLGHKVLRLTVMDEDRFGTDFIGETRVRLRVLRAQQTQKFNIYLEKRAQAEPEEEAVATDRGRILVSLKYVSKKQQLVVGIVRCAALAAMDSNGYSDPYVKVYLKPDKSKKSKNKTRVVKKTLNPAYNQEFTYDMPFGELQQKTLDITVWDKDYAKSSDFIGGVQLSLGGKGPSRSHWLEALKQPDRRHEFWHSLSLAGPETSQ